MKSATLVLWLNSDFVYVNNYIVCGEFIEQVFFKFIDRTDAIFIQQSAVPVVICIVMLSETSAQT